MQNELLERVHVGGPGIVALCAEQDREGLVSGRLDHVIRIDYCATLRDNRDAVYPAEGMKADWGIGGILSTRRSQVRFREELHRPRTDDQDTAVCQNYLQAAIVLQKATSVTQQPG